MFRFLRELVAAVRLPVVDWGVAACLSIVDAVLAGLYLLEAAAAIVS